MRGDGSCGKDDGGPHGVLDASRAALEGERGYLYSLPGVLTRNGRSRNTPKPSQNVAPAQGAVSMTTGGIQPCLVSACLAGNRQPANSGCRAGTGVTSLADPPDASTPGMRACVSTHQLDLRV